MFTENHGATFHVDSDEIDNVCSVLRDIGFHEGAWEVEVDGDTATVTVSALSLGMLELVREAASDHQWLLEVNGELEF